jgi:hypothetical protein
LPKNLREVVERLLARFSGEIRDEASSQPATTAAPISTAPHSSPSEPVLSAVGKRSKEPPAREQSRQAKREARQAHHRLARELRAQGLTIRAIAQRIGLSLKAVVRCPRDPRCPDWRSGRQPPTQLDRYEGLVDQWVANGGRNSAALYWQLRERGCPASYDAVRRYVNRKIGTTGRPGRRTGPAQPSALPPPSARKLSFEFLAPGKQRNQTDEAPQESGLLDRLQARIAILKTGLDLAAELAQMLRKHVSQALSDWLAKAEASGIAEVVNFAAGLRQDETAVAAALTEPWSNGQAEGQTNRLKLIKRAMYGRGSLSLLRARACRKG